VKKEILINQSNRMFWYNQVIVSTTDSEVSLNSK